MSAEADEPTQSARPALVKLTNDVNELHGRLMAGLDSRRDIVEFSQQLTIRTLGEIPDSFYEELARELRFPVGSDQSPFIASLLHGSARDRDMREDAVDDLRREVWMQVVYPAFHRAMRKLRKDAGEYIDDPQGGPGNHAASLQRYIAMRPALDELNHKQEEVLQACLDGFEDRDAIVEWTSDLELATHGEIHEDFAPRCYKESSATLILTAPDNAVAARGRELFAATYLLPYFNKGVRDLAGRAGEQPATERQEMEVPLA